MKWGEIAQANTNLWAASQSTLNQGLNRIGGWRYVLGGPTYDSDMSTTQWGIISLIYNETLGATTPAIVKTDLAKWLATTQNPGTGAGCYQPYIYCDHSDTGGLLLGLKFIDKPPADPAVQAALGFLNSNWTRLQTVPGMATSAIPMPCGRSTRDWKSTSAWITPPSSRTSVPAIVVIPTCRRIKPCNWWEDYNQSLVTSQNANGSWTGYVNWFGPLATAFNVNILGATPIPVGNRLLDDFNRSDPNNPMKADTDHQRHLAVLERGDRHPSIRPGEQSGGARWGDCQSIGTRLI